MEVPLFPLHAVLFPGIAVPLHVFEARYRLLTERCIEASAPFGVVLIRTGREVGGEVPAVAAIGTFAAIREVEQRADGRYDLLVVGTGRFAIDEIDADREPYLVARVTPLDDTVGDDERAAALSAAATRRFVRYLELLKPNEGEDVEAVDLRIEVDSEPGPGGKPDVRIPDDPTVISYLLSGIVQVELPLRQELLEADTTEERLAALADVIEREIGLLGRRLRSFTPNPSLGPVRRN